MKSKICGFIVFFVIGSVLAEYNENLACCHQSMFILNKNKTQCYDPKKNTTLPMRLPCEGNYMKFRNFSINSGMIELQLSSLVKVSFDSDMACYGNVTRDTNLVNATPYAIFCYKYEEHYYDRERVFEKCMITSVVCFILTTIIYAIFAELRDLFGKSIINLCVSMAISMGIFSAIGTPYTDIAECAIRGFSVYYFLMASFFWSNSLAIQVLRDTKRPVSVDYCWKEFRWYALYSWGSPAVLTAIMAIVNYYPGNHLKPGIGINFCWFINEKQQWYYMHSVMTIILVINFGIFIYIATTLWRFAFKSTHMKTLKYKLMMMIRLIVLMGLPWVIEMVRSAVRGRTFIWFVLDLTTALHGVLIFLVLVLRKRVVKALHQRRLLFWCSGPVERWLAKGDDEYDVVQNDVSLHEDNQTDNDIFH